MGFDMTGMMDIVVVDGDDAGELAAALDAILDRSAEEVGRPFAGERLHLKVTDGDGSLLGGLVAERLQGWLYVKGLAVDVKVRNSGIGERLLARAEASARDEQLAGVYLDTFEFQAPRFYQQHGYREIGRLPAAGNAPQRIWFAKTFE
ncbi:acetyltransferase (GNAT) family protein [Ciceribacter lividus]|uniref:Acetyltransferase (GNAT) family protein n=1 Tax=Ciceribacter lividus TaxID=1197950 RepID=A0A6I7HTY2_9HYPH|nr:GNAT family N-acetyltransferase [Ciceribacter lividus]RCW28623.1 acetyltransferase (GNAT) family protein [Ciceribacter lividus]